MTQSQSQSQDHVAPEEAGGPADLVNLQIMLRPEHIALLRGFAEREGATVEALASLWLEEKLDEAVRSSDRPVKRIGTDLYAST